jgi:hypothetical protein
LQTWVLEISVPFASETEKDTNFDYKKKKHVSESLSDPLMLYNMRQSLPPPLQEF